MADIWESYAEARYIKGNAHFDNRSRVYFLDQVLYRRLKLPPAAALLDLGCGIGLSVQSAHILGFKNAKGVDISPSQIEFAKSHFGLDGAVFCVDSLEYLAANTGCFDCIYSLDVFEHLPADYAVELIRAVNAALKPGGVVVLSVPNGHAPLAPTYYGDMTHLRAYSPSSARQLMNYADFNKVEVFESPLWIHGLKSITRSILWKLLLRPVIKAFCLIAYGDSLGGVYTAQMVATGRKADAGGAHQGAVNSAVRGDPPRASPRVS